MHQVLLRPVEISKTRSRKAILTVMIATLLTGGLLAGCRQRSATQLPPSERDRAIAAARQLFAQKKAQGLDMSRGPCLGDVLPDWCADVAHNPRQPVDDEPENQCQSYRSGKVHHFVELDPNGNLIRAE